MPLIIIFLISLLTWTFNPYGIFAGSLMPLSVVTITAIITHHFVIDRMSPETGYLMISNLMFLLVLFATCFVFMVNIFSTKIKGTYKNILAILLYLLVGVSPWLFTAPLF